MNPKTLTLIFSLAALLAGGVVGACVAVAMSPEGKQPAPQTQAKKIEVSTPVVLDPAEAAALAKKKASRLEEIQHDLSACWADVNAEPAKMYAYVSQLPEADLQAILQEASQAGSLAPAKDLALHILFQRDPETATQFVLAKLTAPGGGDQLADYEASKVLGEWLTADPTHALQWATSQSDDRTKKLLLQALPAYAAQDPAAAMQAAETLKDGDETKQFAFISIAQRAAEFDLPAALAAAQNLPPGGDRSSAMSFVLLDGATVDPKTILNLALQRRATEGSADPRDYTLGEVAQQIGEDDPELVLNAAKTVADPKQRAMLVAGAMPALTLQDPQSAWTFATTQFVGAEQLSAIAVVSHDAARNNPDMVAGWITQMPDGAAKNRACEMLLAQWSDQEPDRAAAWVQQLPDDQNKSNQISRVISHWARQDPTASAQWLDSLPAGKARDNADVMYAWQVVSTQPSAAFDRAASISDPVQQQRVLGYLYKREISTDAQAANAWLQKSNLPDDVKQKIIAQGSK